MITAQGKLPGPGQVTGLLTGKTQYTPLAVFREK